MFTGHAARTQVLSAPAAVVAPEEGMRPMRRAARAVPMDLRTGTYEMRGARCARCVIATPGWA